MNIVCGMKSAIDEAVMKEDGSDRSLSLASSNIRIFCSLLSSNARTVKPSLSVICSDSVKVVRRTMSVRQESAISEMISML